MDSTIASIPWSTDWPVSFPLLAAMEYVSTKGLSPETIVSTLSKKLGGRLAYSQDSYRVIGTSEKHVAIIRKGYKPTWDKLAPRQRFTPHNPVISAKASSVLDKEVIELLKKEAICKMSLVSGQYVSTYFVVPKSKRVSDKWRPILNLKKFNKYVCHFYFQM